MNMQIDLSLGSYSKLNFIQMKGGNILFCDFLTVWPLLEPSLLNKKKVENIVLGWLDFGFPW